MSFLNSQKVRLFAGFFCLLFVSSGAAFAQSTRDLTNRINRLENELQTLNRAVYKGDTPPPPSLNDAGAGAGSGSVGSYNSAGMEIRLQQLETELRQLTGKIEEQSYQVRQLKEQVQKQMSDVDLRLGDLERGAGGSGRDSSSSAMRSSSRSPLIRKTDPAAGSAKEEGAYQWNSGSSSVAVNPNIVRGGGSVSVTNDQPAAVYENAFALLKQNNYVAAEREFKVFVDQYPTHVLAGNAKYWLGETYYVRGKYDVAARVFAEAYQQYPKSAKAPDNLLKLGMSLSGLNKKEDACLAFSQLTKDFSDQSTPVLRRAEQERQSLGCGS